MDRFPEPHFSSIDERNVDLLLMEAFAVSPAFAAWFQGVAGLSEAAGDVQSVHHSVSTDSGESDLEIELLDEHGSTRLLLIEDKIAAPLQPVQAERYRLRGRDYVTAGRCDRFETAIVAPAAYFADGVERKGFDGRVNLESVLAWFEAGAESDAGRAFKVTLLRTAIDRGRRGYAAVPDIQVTRFWERYWELCRVRAPELQMPRPSAKPFWSSFVVFKPPDLPTAVRFVHKVRYGRVDMELAGLGDRLDIVHRELGSSLPNGITIERAHKSAALRAHVTSVEMTASWEEELEPVLRESLDAAQTLLAWLRGPGAAAIARLLGNGDRR